MKENSIYMVWNPNGSVPVKRHDCIEQARFEARRLAELEKGQEFFILRAVESHKYSDSPWRVRTFCKGER